MTKYRIGAKWSKTFDYCGMLEAGQKAKVTDPIKALEKLASSYEDVNYHTEADPLFETIELLKTKDRIGAEIKLRVFHRLVECTHKEVCENER